jgi:hypothetical protein
LAWRPSSPRGPPLPRAPLSSPAAGLSLLQRGSAEELLRACFRAYDTNSSGFLERTELTSLVARVYRFVLSEDGTGGAAEAAGAAAVVTRDAFDKFDANGDERLSFAEFCAIVRSDYLLTSWFQLQATASTSSEELLPAAADELQPTDGSEGRPVAGETGKQRAQSEGPWAEAGGTGADGLSPAI